MKLTETRLHYAVLFSVLTLGVILRLFIAWNQENIWYDQVLYCHEATNLINGQWTYLHTHDNNFYTLQESGLSLYNRPLYPILMALLTPITNDVAASGTVVSLTAHLLMLWVIYLICLRLMDPIWAICVLGICATSLTLIEMSVSKYAESLYMLFIAVTAYFVFRFHDNRKPAYAILAGIASGAGYLTKPEFTLLVPAFSLLLLWRSPFDWKRSCGSLLIYVVAFLVAVSPYVVYLKESTGLWQLMPKQKTLYTLIVAERMESMPFGKAYFELNERGTDTILSERVYAESTWELARRDGIHLALRSLRNSYRILQLILPNALKAQAFLFVAAVLAALVIARPCRKRTQVLLAMIMMLLCQLAPLSIMFFLERPLVALVPIIAILSAYSAMIIVQFVAKHLGFSTDRISTIAVALLLMSFLANQLAGYGATVKSATRFAYSREVGHWLAENTASDAIIMSRNPGIPYYAQRRHVILPYGDSNEVYEFGRLKGAEYLVDISGTSFSTETFSLQHSFQVNDGKVAVYRFLEDDSTSSR